jgi:hypothetical protein
MKRNKIFYVFLLLSIFIVTGYTDKTDFWPKTSNENAPWTYWWWMGSSVDKENITYNLEQFAGAGIGGVHIIPIYGVKGYEDKFIDYLSPEWMQMLAFTGSECERLGMGMDMTLGTGWPFGGSQVPDQFASAQIKTFSFKIGKGGVVRKNIFDEIKKTAAENTFDRKREIVTVNAYSDNGLCISLTEKVSKEGWLDWQAPEGNWTVVSLVLEAPVQLVKRAAPGAKGNVLDPFSTEALAQYLHSFDSAFAGYSGKMPRSFYHDSYEYYGADWTRHFLQEFETRQGYDLIEYIPVFLNDTDSEIAARIKSDYRCIIAELHTGFIQETTRWANEKGILFRNQAHGGPVNLLDSYAAADIPECEVFGAPQLDIPGLERDSVFMREEFVDPLLLKFSSSAAHVSGKNLVSSETGTWLAEHFRVSLSQIKPEIDLLFFSGVNHVFYHGIAYSPQGEEWPGWQFYAATSYAPTNSIWYDIPSLNKYVARCQSVLQAGKPDNDILVYHPIWDIWHSPKNGLIPLQVHQPEQWLFGTPFYDTAKMLHENGFSFDYISDKQLLSTEIAGGEIVSNGNFYKTIIVPSCRFLPVDTYRKLLSVIENGGKVIFIGQFPDDVPGLGNYEERKSEISKIRQTMEKELKNYPDRCFLGSNILSMLKETGICGEELSAHKIDFIRRKTDDGRFLFMVNQHATTLNNWVRLAHPARSVVILDPMSGKTGLAETKMNPDGSASVFLQLEPGASLILKILNKAVDYEKWVYLSGKNSPYEVKGEWNVEFIQGGPIIPDKTTVRELQSWTNFNDPETKRFAGTTRYIIEFQTPDKNTNHWILDLGTVRESARVKLNGKDLGVLWAIPFRMPVSGLLSDGPNKLEIEVTNLSANRIRDLDARGVNWKKFYDINFVNIHYKKFDASVWEIRDSGLLGPVLLYPADEIDF